MSCTIKQTLICAVLLVVPRISATSEVFSIPSGFPYPLQHSHMTIAFYPQWSPADSHRALTVICRSVYRSTGGRYRGRGVRSLSGDKPSGTSCKYKGRVQEILNRARADLARAFPTRQYSRRMRRAHVSVARPRLREGCPAVHEFSFAKIQAANRTIFCPKLMARAKASATRSR